MSSEGIEENREQHGVQALETGLGVLEAFVSTSGPMRLTEVASAAGMHPAKAHRYLVSFIRKGYVEQDSAGRYQLGPNALRLGLSYLAQVDFVQLVTPAVNELSEGLNETVFAAVWSPAGPMVLDWRGPWRPIAVNVRIGSVLPMLSSAVGRVFTTFAPPSITQPLIEAELAAARSTRNADAASNAISLDALRLQVRSSGVGTVTGDYVPGVNSVCAPVFDYKGQLVVGIAVVGTERTLDTSSMERAAALLKAAAAGLSAKLGYKPSAEVYPGDRSNWG